MTKIEYSQDKPQKITYIVPAVFVIAGIIIILVGYQKYGMTTTFYSESLIPAICLIIFIAICFRFLMKQNKGMKEDIDRIRREGKKLEGTIVKVNQHSFQSRRNDGTYSTRYYYTFTVEYVDPFTGEDIVVESRKTSQYYEIASGRCYIRVLGEDVLVEEADVVLRKAKWSLVDYILVFGFLAVVIFLVLKTILPILNTL